MRKLLVLVSLTACGTDLRPVDELPPDGGDSPGDSSGGDGYVSLVSGAWTLTPGTEKYLCVRKTVTQDLWIRSIHAVAPLGTHHTVLMTGPADAPDGTTECNSALLKPPVYGSGVGTPPLDMPAGVAIHLVPGDQLLLNLHLYNTSDSMMAGTSGIDIVTTDRAAVQHEAGVVLAGKAAGLYVATGTSTQTGTCTTPAGMTLFAVGPHMHTRGKHMKVTYGARVALDQDYSFDDQRFHMIEPPITTVAGGKYEVTCTYDNPGAPIGFGESTDDEMCYASTFVYPRPTATSCTN